MESGSTYVFEDLLLDEVKSEAVAISSEDFAVLEPEDAFALEELPVLVELPDEPADAAAVVDLVFFLEPVEPEVRAAAVRFCVAGRFRTSVEAAAVVCEMTCAACAACTACPVCPACAAAIEAAILLPPPVLVLPEAVLSETPVLPGPLGASAPVMAVVAEALAPEPIISPVSGLTPRAATRPSA